MARAAQKLYPIRVPHRERERAGTRRTPDPRDEPPASVPTPGRQAGPLRRRPPASRLISPFRHPTTQGYNFARWFQWSRTREGIEAAAAASATK